MLGLSRTPCKQSSGQPPEGKIGAQKDTISTVVYCPLKRGRGKTLPHRV